MKRVLITGVCGFLGSHVAEFFNKLDGWEVCGIDNLTTYELKKTGYDVEKSRKHNLNFIQSIGVKFFKADCTTESSASIEDKFGKVDFIIHCAAQPAMTIAIVDPKEDFVNNVSATFNMLTIAKDLGADFINCSSVHVYGNDANDNLAEAETRFTSNPETINEKVPILQGDLSPLHASKRTTELYTQTFQETYKMRTASFRLTGMYGQRQFGGMDHGWVANFAIRNVTGKPITIFGTDKQVRDILYAQDAAEAFYKWFQNGSSGIFNIGGGMKCSISLGECIKKIEEISNKQSNITLDKARFGDLYYFVCNYDKAKKDFGWEPKVLPIEGLQKMISWINENKEILT